MRNIAIVAEYNPFHNGHKYQIDYIKKELGADNVIVIMSGNFVERGEPAIVNKRVRTEMALACGADMVIELPTAYACASAEFFASCAVDILDATGIVDGICFGCETPDHELLMELSKFFLNESDEYKKLLNDYLKQGLSFPSARAKACKDCISNNPLNGSAYNSAPNNIEAFLNKPNNILALEYVKELVRLDSKMEFFPLKREGSAYNSETLEGQYSSATAIRKALTISNNEVFDYVPKNALDYLLNQKSFASRDAFSDMLLYKLLSEKASGFASYLDGTEDLSNRILSNISAYDSYSAFVDLLKSKNMTESRISRFLLHILLNIKESDVCRADDSGRKESLYARVLGIRNDKTELISLLNKNSAIPVVSIVNKDIKKLPCKAQELFSHDIFASDLYLSKTDKDTDYLSEYEYRLVKENFS
ncbi:MAG: nucleotidyltransferase family protein [Lachnospiraceae bacterium]|nr:nucleotidyltransferase family protein [Lachnospiraceae bacterium]